MLEISDKRGRATLFRERLAAGMTLSGTSRAALARAIGIDRSTISQILSAEDGRMPGAHVVAGAAQTLGVSADWLLGLTDRPEQAGELLATTLSISETGRATEVDDQIFRWHEEAAGYKIRHVPATLPDMLKTTALMDWEYRATFNETPHQAIARAEARRDWMRSTRCDYEIALPFHELAALSEGSGYYFGLDADTRREQFDWFLDAYDELYPTLRVFVFDARRVFSAPLTVFGPKIAAIYLGRYNIAFRDRDRVQALTRHFDWLIRESLSSARQVPVLLKDLRGKVA
ncbi:helix-turn-helix domain-containing protein [Rhodobacterales bacterium HKCCE3408]|nr:helix-turn-helix domain-containing protein [Rhodobacterales bacterium HKCCE3408]